MVKFESALEDAAEKKAAKEDKKDKPRLFVLKFTGDLKASAVDNLREEITALITIATPEDEVLVIFGNKL